MKKTRQRVDVLLVEKGLCESRTLAQALILAGKVRSGTEILDKPGRQIPQETHLSVESPPRFVSRGGEKLQGFLKKHPFRVENLHGLDLGASTGGFTDCLLQNGVATMTCVDVGQAQLHTKLLSDDRVTNLEKLNARTLTAKELPRAPYGVLALDLSFISLKKVLPSAWNLLGLGGHMIALIKPQFEATKTEADKARGIIRDPAIHQRILNEIQNFISAELPSAEIFAIEESSIQGIKGNTEYLIGVRKAK